MLQSEIRSDIHNKHAHNDTETMGYNPASYQYCSQQVKFISTLAGLISQETRRFHVPFIFFTLN